jgi:tripartite-type tricarboxylate transporter receptor subunit TctC
MTRYRRPPWAKVHAMKLQRRQFLRLLAEVTTVPAVSRIARGQTYPARPVRIIVGFAAGGTYDIMARLVGQSLSERLGRQFLIENRTGGSGNIAVEAVVHASADGYTLLLSGSNDAINATLFEKLNFNFIRDVAPVAGIARLPNVMVVARSFPAKTLADFISDAKANPGIFNIASAGTGTANHMSGELLKAMGGINMLHVPYRGGAPALADLLGGQVQVMFSTVPAVIEYIRAGKLRALAVTTETRLDMLPDVPAITEFLPGYEATTWNGIVAPRNTPAVIVDKLNGEVNAGLADPKMKMRFAELGGTALPGSPEDFAKLIADDTEKWGRVIRAANIKAE